MAAADLENNGYYIFRGTAEEITNPVVQLRNNKSLLALVYTQIGMYYYFDEEEGIFKSKSVETANLVLEDIKNATGIVAQNTTALVSVMYREKISGVLATL